jgi:hypothetical protein
MTYEYKSQEEKLDELGDIVGLKEIIAISIAVGQPLSVSLFWELIPPGGERSTLCPHLELRVGGLNNRVLIGDNSERETHIETYPKES